MDEVPEHLRGIYRSRSNRTEGMPPANNASAFARRFLAIEVTSIVPTGLIASLLGPNTTSPEKFSPCIDIDEPLHSNRCFARSSGNVCNKPSGAIVLWMGD